MLSAPLQRRKPSSGTPSPKIESKTILWVSGIHVAVLLVLLAVGWLFKPKADERFIEIIDLGNAGLNPVTDTSDPLGGGTPAPSTPKPQPQTPPAPTPVKPKPVEAATPPPPQPKPEPVQPNPKPKPVQPKIEQPANPVAETPSPKPTPTPAPPAPTKPKVNVNTSVTQKTTANASPATPNTNSKLNTASGGPSPEQIRQQLAAGLGKTQGTGNPSAGSVSGVKGANSYNTVIHDTLRRNWDVPPGPPPAPALVKIRIYPDGRVEFLSFAQSSGRPEVDASIVNAVNITGALPKPLPPELGSPNYDVTVEFNSKF